MKGKKKLLSLIFLIIIFIVVGCTLRRIPNPNMDSNMDSNMDFNLPGGGSRISPHDNYSPGWENTSKIAENIRGQAVKVPGVKDAAVVVYNTSAYVGIKTNGKDTDGDRGLIEQVAKKTKETEGTITTVYVSTDANFMKRISEFSNNMKSGTPKGNFKNEIDELVRNMQPIE